ncbi:MAG: methionine gamma-lyase [Planctomycetota bacterium]
MPEPLYGTRRAPSAPAGPLSAPLIRATTHAQHDAESIRRMGAAEVAGEFYPRMGHANCRLFESLVAELEGSEGAVSFASGMAAMSGAILGLCGAGDAVAVAEEIYGGTSALVAHELPRFGVATVRFSSLDLGTLAAALAGRPRAVVFETPINPTLRLADIRAVVDLCRRGGALTILDGTFAPPPIQRAMDLGVDLVVHSATKFFGGHSDVLAGVVAGRRELLDRIEGFRRRTGGILAPDPAWLLCRSWPTLPLRLEAQQASAGRIARELSRWVASGRIRAVAWPGSEDHPDRDIARSQMAGGGCLVSFEVHGGLDGARAVFDSFRRIARAPSLGGVETLASIPAFTTHASLSAEQRARAGIPDGLIRLSVGLEDSGEILSDLDQAIRQ